MQFFHKSPSGSLVVNELGAVIDYEHEDWGKFPTRTPYRTDEYCVGLSGENGVHTRPCKMPLSGYNKHFICNSCKMILTESFTGNPTLITDLHNLVERLLAKYLRRPKVRRIRNKPKTAECKAA